MPWLINATQVEKFRKNQKNLIILDASLHHDDRDAKTEFLDKHITGAQFFNITEFCDTNTNLPNMIELDENKINEKLGKLGIKNDYKIIFYDNSELHTSARALWMFKVFGHNPQLLYILNGGFKSWQKDGKKTESGESNHTPKIYTSSIQKQYLNTLSDIKNIVKNSTNQIIDVRHPVRYSGGPEPRDNLRQGHIPGSFCLPFYTLFSKEGNFISAEHLRKKFKDLGVDINAPITTTCGSGLTAPILDFLIDLMPDTKHFVYDGSWSEWGYINLFPDEKSIDERPIEDCISNK
ncbi:rhodanese-like domain-containing protein [Gammaproteobacteria bacterium]|nr:rhodanese-like domain-containing protein [Gammaproteobacteria bacterium]